MKKFELLMPAGNLEKLKWAIAYGADAVYAGVPMFSLRARENQFTWETLAEAVELSLSWKKDILHSKYLRSQYEDQTIYGEFPEDDGYETRCLYYE